MITLGRMFFSPLSNEQQDIYNKVKGTSLEEMYKPVSDKYDRVRPDMEKLASYVHRNKGIIEHDDFTAYAIQEKISPDAILYLYERGTCDSEMDINIIKDITNNLLGSEYKNKYVSEAHKIMRFSYITPEEYLKIIKEGEDE